MKTNRLLITLMLLGALLLAGCNPRAGARVGALRSESQSVELGNAEPVRVEIDLGAGDLKLAGGADKLLEADFNYNVDRLKPAVEYTDGRLVVSQPGAKGLPLFQDVTGFRNEWNLRLYDQVPMDLSVKMGAGTSDLQLGGLSLTGLKASLGAGTYTLDLSGDWPSEFPITIDSGAANVTVRLPKDVGARVKVEAGPHTIEAPGLTKDGNVYTNAAYDTSDVKLQVDLQAGVGQINLDVEE